MTRWFDCTEGELRYEHSSAGDYEHHYDPYKVELAADLKVGDEWITNYDWTRYDQPSGNVGASSTGSSDRFVVEGEEEITVPAGTFTVLRIKRYDESGDSSDFSDYYAKGVGLVSTGYSDLLSYSPQ